ncbi:MAG: ShlB/FhaC/HecB family hemolysin secretion/activation protein [Sulfuriferula sp.]
MFTLVCLKKAPTYVLVAGLLACSFPGETDAQPLLLAAAATPSAASLSEEGLRRQEESNRELQQRLQPKSDVLQPEAPTVISDVLPIESPCFPVHEIDLAGKDAQHFYWLVDATRPFLNQCVGVAGLRRIVEILDTHLIAAGYATTRVSLLPQNLKNGKLEIQLNVGRIQAVKMVQAGSADDAPDQNWGTWRNAMPVNSGDILNIRDLEQGIEQMKRLPSQWVTTRIKPGTQPDTSVILIQRRAVNWQDRLRGGFVLDNSGNQAMRRAQFSGYMALDNALGLNDILSLSLSSNAQQIETNHRNQSITLNYSIPWGYSTFSLSASHNRFAQQVQGTTTQFLSSGSSDSAELRWDYTAWRSASAKAGWYVGLTNRSAHSYLDDVELIVQRSHTTNLEAGVTYRQLFGHASLDLSLGYRRGVPWMGAQDDFATAAAGGLTMRPRLWILNAAYNQPLHIGGRAVQYVLSLHAQQTHDTTLSIDQIAIGNRYTVRGFNGDNVLLAESGYYVRNELATPMTTVAGWNTAAFVDLDFGRVWGPSAAYLIGDKLAGTALGMRAQQHGWQFEVAVAAPVYAPKGFQAAPIAPYISLAYGF